MTTPIGPFDFFFGGADLATLFVGTGALEAGPLGIFETGPLEGGPTLGSADFFGVNGDWVTLDPPSLPFAGGVLPTV